MELIYRCLEIFFNFGNIPTTTEYLVSIPEVFMIERMITVTLILTSHLATHCFVPISNN